MSKLGGDNRKSGDPGSGPTASVHELDAARGRHREDVARRPKAPRDAPTPDRTAALNMLGTFDLDGIDAQSADEILANLEAAAAVSGRSAPLKDASPEERASAADRAAVADVDSDEILRELEEHHRREQLTVRPSALRGSAERRPSARRPAPRAPRRTGRKATRTASTRRGRRRSAALVVAVLLPLTIASTVALSHVGGTGARSTDHLSSGTLPTAAEITPFAPLKVFGSLANLFSAEARRLARHNTSPIEHRRRKPRTRKPTASRRPVGQAAAAQVVSTTPGSSISSSNSSSSSPASSTQSATSAPAPVAKPQQTQPAFGQNGSLGPGRGAPGTQ